MAKIEVKTNVIAPEQIDIPLVREDFSSVSDIFRICFEVFLALFSCLLGVILSSDKKTITPIYLISAGVCLIFAIISLCLVFYYRKKARCNY